MASVVRGEAGRRLRVVRELPETVGWLWLLERAQAPSGGGRRRRGRRVAPAAGGAAFVVLKPGAESDGATLQCHCREHLAGFKVPKHVGLIGQMPATCTGKLQKNVPRGASQELFTQA